MFWKNEVNRENTLKMNNRPTHFFTLISSPPSITYRCPWTGVCNKRMQQAYATSVCNKRMQQPYATNVCVLSGMLFNLIVSYVFPQGIQSQGFWPYFMFSQGQGRIVRAAQPRQSWYSKCHLMAFHFRNLYQKFLRTPQLMEVC